MTVLRINGHDYSKYVKDDGYDWSRDDLDGPETGRVKTGTMRRTKVAEKRNLTYSMIPMPEALAAQLDTDLHASEFSVTYHDLHGDQTRQFYCSKLPGKLRQIIDEKNVMWGNISFNLHEI